MKYFMKANNISSPNFTFLDTLVLSLPLSLIASLFAVVFVLKPFHTTLGVSFVSPYGYPTGIPVMTRILEIEPIFYIALTIFTLSMVCLVHVVRLLIFRFYQLEF